MSKGMNKGLFPWRTALTCVALAFVSWGVSRFSTWGWLALCLVNTFLTLRLLYWFKRGRHGAKAYVNRAERKQERSDGVMSRWDHMKNCSATAMRIRWARILQPGRSDLSWWRIFREPVTAYAREIGMSEYGKKWIPLNAHRTFIAAARSGKSQDAMYGIIEHEGPVLATSTRGEVVDQTAVLRMDKGPVMVFNAGRVGHHPSNLKWSVLAGCKDMNVAQRRAADLVGPSIPGSDKENWDNKAIDVLGPLLYLAAHKGFSVGAVQRWVGVSSDQIPGVWRWIQQEMRQTPDGAFALGGLEIFFGLNDRTRTSITSSLGPALAWLSNPETAELGDSDDSDFDIVQDFLATGGTIYLLGGGQGSGPVQALMRALVSEITFQASEYAEKCPKGRLYVPMLMALDELNLTCPGPVDKWVLDMGGRGIVMDLIVQQRSALDDIWGVTGRDAILGNSLVVQVGAGLNSRQVAEDFAVISGTRTELRRSYDADGELTGSTEVEVPVFDPGKLMSLQTGESIQFTRGRVDFVKTRRAETRRDVKRVLSSRQSTFPVGRMSRDAQEAQRRFAQDLEEGRV